MDFNLRCNSLKCRKQLTETAVVTTCSHVFCDQCTDSLGLNAAAGNNRICPACQTALDKPDDAAITLLQPTEDYKTSVLSGLSPSTIMECAARGLAFWSYQTTQEIIYQEYLAKTLTDKYSTLNVQMDKVIHDANSELNILNQKLSNMQIDQDRLKAENTDLVAAYREKHRKYQQTQDLYDRLKRKEMMAATQSAAFDSVDEVLGKVATRPEHGPSMYSNQYPNARTQAQLDFQLGLNDHSGIEQAHMHQRNGSTNSQGSGGRMPPPLLRRSGDRSHAFGHATAEPPPSVHRTQLGPTAQPAGRLGTGGLRNQPSMMNRSPKGHASAQRQPFGNLGTNSVNRPGAGGYGMSAGMKISQQQGGESHFDVHGFIRVTASPMTSPPIDSLSLNCSSVKVDDTFDDG